MACFEFLWFYRIFNVLIHYFEQASKTAVEVIVALGPAPVLLS